ncbi:hypothetical protein RI367_000936 [Sorochytrium milnesiophthora]
MSTTSSNTNGASVAATASSSPSSSSLVATSSSAAHVRFVVAIDFGTSHSGFAYSHKADEKNIEALYNWDSAPQPYSKTLSALLYDPQNKPIAWGFTAQQKYMRLPPNQRQTHKYITRFKLFLDEKYPEPMPEGLNDIAMIGDYLRFMKEKIREVLTVKFGQTFSLAHVQWCLTVPAMWTDRAKFHTRKAAAYAGIVDEPNSPKLQIILEPEAAAVFVAKNVPGSLDEGDVFMVLDAGGGTVDLTVHQYRVNGEDGQTFAEVAPGLGDTCGSTFVDENFLQFFAKKVGMEAFERAIAEKYEDIFAVLKSWEPIKRSFKGAAHYGVVGGDAAADGAEEERESINIPNKIYSWMSEEQKAKLGEEQEGFDDAVMISPTEMQSFFDPVIDKIEGLVDVMLSRCPPVDSASSKSGTQVNKIMCVGGFSESQYLVRRIRERYEARGVSVFCPADPGAIVVKGAVNYGLNPTTIISRRARQTYGLAVRGYWSDNFPESKRSWDDYQKCWMVEDKFDVLVAVNDELAVNHAVKRTYYPPAIWSTSIRLSLYGTKSPTPRFVDEEGCTQLAEITVPLELDPEKSINDYPIAISVSFGATEINIQARNTRTHTKFNVAVNYDKHPVPKAVPASSSNTVANTTTLAAAAAAAASPATATSGNTTASQNTSTGGKKRKADAAIA